MTLFAMRSFVFCECNVRHGSADTDGVPNRLVPQPKIHAVTTATRIAIDFPSHPSALIVQRGALPHLGKVLAAESIAVRSRRVLVVVDANVAQTHAITAVDALKAAGMLVTTVELTASETEKSMRAVETVWHAALEGRLDRGSLIVALGGGLIGDVAGFAAASYLRGIDLVQVPTTLLAMVDASIGGKTGVNLPLPGGGIGKNLAGAFWQPRLTVADADLLRTLALRELRAGLAECVKHAVIAGEDAFAQLERDAALLCNADGAALDALIPLSAAVKAAIVTQDPFERGVRAHLNLGHTFGHAIETIPSLQLLHGEAVAIGLLAAAHCAAATWPPYKGQALELNKGQALESNKGQALELNKGQALELNKGQALELNKGQAYKGQALVGRLEQLLVALGLPTKLGMPVLSSEVLRRMGFDKKNEGGGLKLVLPRGLGDVVVTSDAPPVAVVHALACVGAV
jgi:3-dehydroquinate synthase